MKSWFAQSYYEQDDTAGDVSTRIENLLTELSLDYFSYIVLKPPRDLPFDSAATLQSSYPDEWVKRYMSRRYFQLDPVCALAMDATRPFYWGQGRFLRPFRKQQRRVFDEARDFRITHGLTIPIRGARGELGVFSVVSSDKRHLADVTRGEHARLFEAAFDTHDIMMADQTAQQGTKAEPIRLSTREKECLLWTLEGKTASDIATILGLSVSTVNHHASTASQKLGSSNKHHAAVQALRSGLIC